jgi:hypothetical protein
MPREFQSTEVETDVIPSVDYARSAEGIWHILWCVPPGLGMCAYARRTCNCLRVSPVAEAWVEAKVLLVWAKMGCSLTCGSLWCLPEGKSWTSETSWITSPAKDTRVEVARNWYGLHRWFTPHFCRVWLYLGDRGQTNQSSSLHPCETTYTGAKLAELYMAWIVCLHGVPKKIVSDRGSQFTSWF